MMMATTTARNMRLIRHDRLAVSHRRSAVGPGLWQIAVLLVLAPAFVSTQPAVQEQTTELSSSFEETWDGGFFLDNYAGNYYKGGPARATVAFSAAAKRTGSRGLVVNISSVVINPETLKPDDWRVRLSVSIADRSRRWHRDLQRVGLGRPPNTSCCMTRPCSASCNRRPSPAMAVLSRPHVVRPPPSRPYAPLPFAHAPRRDGGWPACTAVNDAAAQHHATGTPGMRMQQSPLQLGCA